MFDLPTRTFFFIVVILSLLLFIYDTAMLKLGLYKKVLRKAKPLTPEKYNQFKMLLKLLMPISQIWAFTMFIICGAGTGQWVFFLYMYGSIAVVALPCWLILKHIGEQNIKMHRNLRD